MQHSCAAQTHNTERNTRSRTCTQLQTHTHTFETETTDNHTCTPHTHTHTHTHIHTHTQAAKKAVIHELVGKLEASNPVPAPVDNLHLCAGSWELLYSTITITVGDTAIAITNTPPLPPSMYCCTDLPQYSTVLHYYQLCGWIVINIK